MKLVLTSLQRHNIEFAFFEKLQKIIDYVICCRWENLIYKFGCHQETIGHVIFHGDVVHSKQ